MAMTTGIKALAAVAAAAMQEALMAEATVAAPAYGDHAADVSIRHEPVECARCLSDRLRFFVLRSTL
jgi:hypothetical protein